MQTSPGATAIDLSCLAPGTLGAVKPEIRSHLARQGFQPADTRLGGVFLYSGGVLADSYLHTPTVKLVQSFIYYTSLVTSEHGELVGEVSTGLYHISRLKFFQKMK